MLHFMMFAVIFGIMMFIWTFVFLNRSHDQINQAFLLFLSMLILWMILDTCVSYRDQTLFALIVKTVYWYSMLTISLFCMIFVYRLVHRPLDTVFYGLVAINLLTIAARYLFPMDYTQPTFWRLSTPVVAPLMSTIFCLPIIRSLQLVLSRYRTVQDMRQKTQFRVIFWGTGLACVVSVISEYLLPAVFHVTTQLHMMLFAILIFVIFVFISIMKYRLLNIQSDYVFRKLFLNSCDGTIISNRNGRIISINNVAKEILHDAQLDSGDRIADYIPGYTFDEDYRQREVHIDTGVWEGYLAITQYSINTDDQELAKLLTITDITSSKQDQLREREQLIENSFIDQLTGLYNKRYYMNRYGTGQQHGNTAPLSLLFIDVDDFRHINERYGHLVGDRVLHTLAECIRKVIREDTEAIRFGGDEFVVVLERTPVVDALAVAERIRRSVELLSFADCEEGLLVTVSIGLIDGYTTINDLILKADMAMYGSKSQGKNMTTVYSETDTQTFHMKLEPPGE